MMAEEGTERKWRDTEQEETSHCLLEMGAGPQHNLKVLGLKTEEGQEEGKGRLGAEAGFRGAEKALLVNLSIKPLWRHRCWAPGAGRDPTHRRGTERQGQCRGDPNTKNYGLPERGQTGAEGPMEPPGNLRRARSRHRRRGGPRGRGDTRGQR